MSVPTVDTFYFIRPASPLVFRSGQPFGAAGVTGSDGMDFPLPGSVAGALRGAWVDATGHPAQTRDDILHALEMQGGLLVERTWGAQKLTLYLRKPADAIYEPNAKAKAEDDKFFVRSLKPMGWPSQAGGCDLPHGLHPLVAPADMQEEQTDDGPIFWYYQDVQQWLLNPMVKKSAGRQGLPRAIRTHVGIDADSLSAREGALFQTDGLDFDQVGGELGLFARFHTRRASLDTHVLDGRMGRLGADGRAARFEALPDTTRQMLSPPQDLITALDKLKVGQRLRLLLLTPACYLRNGAYPDGFLPTASGHLEGRPVVLEARDAQKRRLPEAEQPWRFRLVAAALPNWQPMSTSSLRDDRGQACFTRRALRRLVPAGSVYWLELLHRAPHAPSLARLWWQSTCRAEYARDGYGLSLPGLA